MVANVAYGSGFDDECVENLKLRMTGIEKWIFQADEYQQSAKSVLSMSD